MVGVGRPLPPEILPIIAHSASAVTPSETSQEVHYALSNEPKKIIIRCP